jgi:hypothetical protein
MRRETWREVSDGLYRLKYQWARGPANLQLTCACWEGPTAASGREPVGSRAPQTQPPFRQYVYKLVRALMSLAVYCVYPAARCCDSDCSLLRLRAQGCVCLVSEGNCHDWTELAAGSMTKWAGLNRAELHLFSRRSTSHIPPLDSHIYITTTN